jgi:hypothetical protein
MTIPSFLIISEYLLDAFLSKLVLIAVFYHPPSNTDAAARMLLYDLRSISFPFALKPDRAKTRAVKDSHEHIIKLHTLMCSNFPKN